MNVHLIYNPLAGAWDAHRAIDRIQSQLTKRGWTVEAKATERQGDATKLARQAAEAHCDAAIVAGGDGTVNEAVNGLVGSETALGVLPIGTVNVWARQLGLPHSVLAQPLILREAVEELTQSAVCRVDVGQANDRCFLCWAGIGLDARVTAKMEPRTKSSKRLGPIPYVIAASQIAQDFRGVRARVRMNDEVERGRTLLVLASNIQQYAGEFKVASEAKIDDGLLDIFIFKGLGFSYIVGHLLKILSQRHFDDPQVVYRRAHHIQIKAEEEMPLQVDGEPIGETPVRLRILPRALRALVPPSAPTSLFKHPPEETPQVV